VPLRDSVKPAERETRESSTIRGISIRQRSDSRACGESIYEYIRITLTGRVTSLSYDPKCMVPRHQES
jgi:hypothetical protein